MPSDITGRTIIQETRRRGGGSSILSRGRFLRTLLLADEINRTPPKTQARCCRRCRKSQVTAAGQTFGLEPPFFVLATQNPVEQEGTYPLPEAQLDRFMFMVKVGYPAREEEKAIVKST